MDDQRTALGEFAQLLWKTFPGVTGKQEVGASLTFNPQGCLLNLKQVPKGDQDKEAKGHNIRLQDSKNSRWL